MAERIQEIPRLTLEAARIESRSKAIRGSLMNAYKLNLAWENRDATLLSKRLDSY